MMKTIFFLKATKYQRQHHKLLYIFELSKKEKGKKLIFLCALCGKTTRGYTLICFSHIFFVLQKLVKLFNSSLSLLSKHCITNLKRILIFDFEDPCCCKRF